MSEFSILARPYAEAVFNFAFAHQKVEYWQYVLTFFTEVIKNKQIEKLLLSNLLESKKLVELFTLIFGDELDQSGKNLIHIMVENNRLNILPEVLKQFILLREKSESISEIQIISSNTLSKKQISKITFAVEKRFSRKLKVNLKIDKSIIAGVIIRLDDVIIDGSVRSRLKRLVDVLQS